MNYSREDRLKIFFKKLTADFLKTELDTRSLVTITGVTISKDLRGAIAFVSVFPETLEKEVFKSLKKKKAHFIRYLHAHTKMKVVPSIRFEIDRGEKNRRKIDDLLSKK